MEKVTIKFDDGLFKKINDRMIRNGCKSISQCTRELIDLGLKIEEAASMQADGNDEDGIHPVLLSILKTSLIWSLETRFLVRFLVEKKIDIDSDQMRDFMKKAKEKAITHVADLMKKTRVAVVDGD